MGHGPIDLLYLLSLKLSQFVDRQYWLRRCASPHRFRANLVKRGESQGSVPLFLETNCNHLQILIN
jgi:hypothetical protein